ncbi:MAG: hypothetical protein H0U72_00640 [Nitrosospira sp.]|nr:hypothetical protein [Nitrosospira sp.]
MANPYLEIAGHEFRTTAAFSAPLFSLGVIDRAGRNRFDPRGEPTIRDHSVKILTHYQTAETEKASIDAEAEAGVEGIKGGINLKREKEETQKGIFALIRNTEIYKLVDKLNEPINADLLRRLKEERDSPVIITSVAIVSSNEIYSKSELAGGLTASISSVPGAPTIKFQGSTGSESRASFSDGTVFAYEYSRIHWDKDSAAPKIKRIEVDKPA